MAIAYRSSGTFTEANSTSSGAIGLPAGLANGDVLILLCQARGASATVTTPSGYTLAQQRTVTSSHQFLVFYKYVTNAAGEAAPTVTQSVSQAIRCRLSAFSGVSSTTQLDVAPTSDTHAASSTLTAPSITPASQNTMTLWCFSSGDDNTLNAASASGATTAYSSDGTAGSDGSIALVYKLQTTASASGTCDMTESVNGPDNWATITLALRPTVAAAADPSRTLGFDSITYAVEMAFGESPFSPSPTWTDVSAYVRADVGITVTRGRNSTFTDTSPGTMTFTLNNRGRIFDPDYSSGTYFGQLVPQVRCRLRLRKSSTNYPIFDGYVQGWPQGYTYPREATVDITCVDLFSRLATRLMPSSLLDLECIADGAKGHWPLDEDPGSGTGIAFDNSGNGANGAWNGATVDSFLQGEPGRKMKGFSPSDSIQLGFGAGDDGGTGGFQITHLRTLEFWLAIDTFTTASGYSFGYIGLDGPFGPIFELVEPVPVDPVIEVRMQCQAGFFLLRFETDELTNGTPYIVFNAYMYDATNTPIYVFGNDFLIGQPMHVVFVLDETETTLTLYMNGQVLQTVGGLSGTFDGGSLEPNISITTVGVVSGAFGHFAGYDTALTATQVLAHYSAGTTGGRNQHPSDRLEEIADFCGLVDAGLFDDGDLADHTYLSRASFSGNALAAMQDIVRTEQGRMFVDASGVLQVQGRTADIHDLTVNATSQATLSDSGSLAYADLTIDAAELELLRNTIYLSTNGGQAVVYDVDSRALYDERSESITVLLDDVTAAQNLGLWRTMQFADPATRITSVTLKPHGSSDTRYTTCFTVDLGWRVTITRTPQSIGSAISKVCTVEGIQHHVDERGPWMTTLYLAPAVDDYTTHTWWVLGDSTYGKLDGTHCKLPY